MADDTSRIISLIKQHGLHIGPRRNLSFFSMSTVSRGYTQELRQLLGFSYDVFGGMVEENQTLSIVNDAAVVKKVESFLQQHPRQLDEHIFPLTKKYLEEYNNPQSLLFHADLHQILSFYPSYFGIIGIYNALNRYVTETDYRLLTSEQLQAIGSFRNQLGGMYPIIDAHLMKQFQHYPPGKLLGYLTFGEMKAFLASGAIPPNLSERQQECIYLYVEQGNKEFIITDRMAAAECKKFLYPKIEKGVTTLTGQSIYPGKVTGTVAIMPRNSELPADAIIVTSMTTVNEASFIARAKAIVADEGGVLCHAAIIARELKKPCIVGTKIGSRLFKEGDLVEVDAYEGTIRKIL